jgi:TP53 regulating kinase-like protein
LILEFVEGRTVRVVLDEWVERVGMTGGQKVDGDVVGNREREEQILSLMARIGQAVGRLHAIGIVHGDLTTSNLMLRPPLSSPSSYSSSNTAAETPPPTLEGDVVLIDFGLAAQSPRQMQEEDRAVDLYVLERAFAATHPSAEELFQEVLRAYGVSYKGAQKTLSKLEGVRLRGRKRSMLG